MAIKYIIVCEGPGCTVEQVMGPPEPGSTLNLYREFKRPTNWPCFDGRDFHHMLCVSNYAAKKASDAA